MYIHICTHLHTHVFMNVHLIKKTSRLLSMKKLKLRNIPKYAKEIGIFIESVDEKFPNDESNRKEIKILNQKYQENVKKNIELINQFADEYNKPEDPNEPKRTMPLRSKEFIDIFLRYHFILIEMIKKEKTKSDVNLELDSYCRRFRHLNNKFDNIKRELEA